VLHVVVLGYGHHTRALHHIAVPRTCTAGVAVQGSVWNMPSYASLQSRRSTRTACLEDVWVDILCVMDM
jgi:hypothetical protein